MALPFGRHRPQISAALSSLSASGLANLSFATCLQTEPHPSRGLLIHANTSLPRLPSLPLLLLLFTFQAKSYPSCLIHKLNWCDRIARDLALDPAPHVAVVDVHTPQEDLAPVTTADLVLQCRAQVQVRVRVVQLTEVLQIGRLKSVPLRESR